MPTRDEQIAQSLRDSQPDPEAPQADAMRRRLGKLQQQLALRLERLRVSGSL